MPLGQMVLKSTRPAVVSINFFSISPKTVLVTVVGIAGMAWWVEMMHSPWWAEENFVRIGKNIEALLFVGLFQLLHLLLAGRLGQIVATERVCLD